jgi:hypothetical protein
MPNELIISAHSNYEQFIPAWEHAQPGTKLIPAWDRVVIDQIIATAARWAKFNPVTDSFETLWPLVESDLYRARIVKLFGEVRNLLSDLPITIEPFGGHPGGPPYMEAIAFNTPTDGDYATVSFGGTYDETSYTSIDGSTVVSQVWFTDQNGDIDVIELDHLDADRIALAFRHMWDKHTPKYRNTMPTES